MKRRYRSTGHQMKGNQMFMLTICTNHAQFMLPRYMMNSADKVLVKGKVKSFNFKGFRSLGYLLPLSHTLPLTTVKRSRLTRSSICNILLALDIRNGCQHEGFSRSCFYRFCSKWLSKRILQTSI